MKFDINSLLGPDAYDHPVDHIELLETHISWVLLTGEFAYKIKKPVDFGFLDFSTLEKRRACCEQELHLNRRLAPGIYLNVVAIAAVEGRAVIAGQGIAIEYAVKMRQFPQACQLDQRLAAGELKPVQMEAIARMLAEFHQRVDVADASTAYGNSAAVYQPVAENFAQIAEHMATGPYRETLAALQQWSRDEYEKRKPVFEQRKRDGFIRECHGDLHLRNLVWLDNGPAAFDCIEFNPALRWIDVISDVAFLVMDLQDRQQPRLANRFLNSYLEITGDYAALSVLPFYLCYRAMVRAKVDALRLEQHTLPAAEAARTREEFASYLALATRCTQPPPPRLVIMRGVSASGKSTVSQQLVDTLGALRIRSDVERKRLFDVEPDSTFASEIDRGMYSEQASRQTYAKLLELAGLLVDAGVSVIVDAAFLRYEQREAFAVFAKRRNISFRIVETVAPVEVLRQRILHRKHDVSDADLAVLEHQLSRLEPLRDEERASAVVIDTTGNLPDEVLLERIA